MDVVIVANLLKTAFDENQISCPSIEQLTKSANFAS